MTDSQEAVEKTGQEEVNRNNPDQQTQQEQNEKQADQQVEMKKVSADIENILKRLDDISGEIVRMSKNNDFTKETKEQESKELKI